MISSVVLENFKAHAHTKVDLGRITMLVGPNGAGKTSVLQALEAISRSVDAAPEHVLVGALHPSVLARRSTDKFHVIVECEQHLRATLAVEELDVDSWESAVRLGEGDWGPRQTLRALGESPLWSSLSGARRYRLDAEKIRAISTTADRTPKVGLEGEDTATVLATMKLEDDERFGAVEQSLREIVPQLKRIHLRRLVVTYEKRKIMGYGLSFDFTSGTQIPSSAVSDGTLVTTALLTILFQRELPSLVLLDDIDQSLHPAAQRELMRQLKNALASRTQLQIVATTHSPYILDELQPEDVRVFALRADGTVAVKRLSEHPEAGPMKGALTTGQLWALDPEQAWVVSA